MMMMMMMMLTMVMMMILCKVLELELELVGAATQNYKLFILKDIHGPGGNGCLCSRTTLPSETKPATELEGCRRRFSSGGAALASDSLITHGPYI